MWHGLVPKQGWIYETLNGIEAHKEHNIFYKDTSMLKNIYQPHYKWFLLRVRQWDAE